MNKRKTTSLVLYNTIIILAYFIVWFWVTPKLLSMANDFAILGGFLIIPVSIVTFIFFIIKTFNKFNNL